jgi:hypothetical protein
VQKQRKPEAASKSTSGKTATPGGARAHTRGVCATQSKPRDVTEENGITKLKFMHRRMMTGHTVVSRQECSDALGCEGLTGGLSL